MKTIDIGRVSVAPDRQRKTFDEAKLHEFGDGIAKTGLLHPIVLRQNGGVFTLVAGERRLRAINDLIGLGIEFKHDGQLVPPGQIPYTLMEDLNELAYEEAELDENIQRVDLTWQEQAAAHARLSVLRGKQAALRGETPPSVSDLARELRPEATQHLADHDLGIYQADLRKEIIVARYLDNPEVKAAKTLRDAYKVLKKQEASDKHRALSASVGATFTSNVHHLEMGDSLDWMRKALPEQFDCILTDPPYGMGADEFGDSGGLAAGAHGYVDDWDYARGCYETLAIEGHRLAKPQAHMYAFCDIDNFPELKTIFTAAGWQVFRTPLIWYKRQGSRAPWPEHGPQRKYETVLYAIKGKRAALRMAGDVLDFPSDENLGHAAQKPVALYQELLSRTCLPGDTVFDPFCGTGPIFPAAHALRVKATGVERDSASYGIAVTRIQELATKA